MSDNLRHWSALSRTDPKHTKPFSRAGGFRGTATRPIWTEMRLTEHFGPCGVGWGCDAPEFSLVPAGDETLVFCTLRCWYMDGETRAPLYGVGGDKVYFKDKNGFHADDEAYKKAFTDALGNAFKHVGSGADIHMGLFEDSKYKAEIAAEFAEEGAGRPTDVRLARAPSQPPKPANGHQAPTSAPVLPVNPEEPPAIGRQRVEALCHKLDAGIKAAKNSLALDTWWASADVKTDLSLIEAGGAAGQNAAYKLRSRYMERADQLKDAEALV